MSRLSLDVCSDVEGSRAHRRSSVDRGIGGGFRRLRAQRTFDARGEGVGGNRARGGWEAEAAEFARLMDGEVRSVKCEVCRLWGRERVRRGVGLKKCLYGCQALDLPTP